MAFIEYDSIGNIPTFYNLNFAVGQGCYNMIEDVKVVQFFLQRVYTTEKFKAGTPKGAMTVDGKCGPVTRNWILKFQLDLRKMGKTVMVDGIIDKAGNDKGNRFGSISGTTYTIRLLNRALHDLDAPVYRTLTSNPIVPVDVRLIFLQIHAEGPAMTYGNGN